MKQIVCVQFNVKGQITTNIICQSWSVHSRLWYQPPACMPKDEVENMVKLQKPPLKIKMGNMSAQFFVNLVSLL